MRFDVTFYETADGKKPMVEFLNDVRKSQPTIHSLLVAGIKKLEDDRYLRPPLTKLVDATWKIYELRVGSANIARVFFFFQSGQRIILTHGYIKKSQQLDPKEIERARRYMTAWKERNP
jgi:phage-related protein